MISIYFVYILLLNMDFIYVDMYYCIIFDFICRRSFDSVNKNEFIMDVFSLCM